MLKNKKLKKLLSLIFIIILCCCFQTIVYCALYTTMTITGTAYARPTKDVRITGVKLNSQSTNSTSSYEEFGVNTISTKFNLVGSSSSIVFDVEVTNYGSLDVGILQLIGTIPTGLSYEIINYNLKDKICDDTGKCNQMAVKTFQIKFTGTPGEYEVNLELDFRTYHKVTYTDITNNNYPTEVIDGGNLNITFTENLEKVTILSDGTEIGHYDQINSGHTITIENVSRDIEIKKNKELVAILASGDIDEVGSEVCIKDECFYVISSTDDTVTMLAKYNLYVGNSVDSSRNVTPLASPTGKQSELARGWVNDTTEWYGITAFSSSSQQGTNRSDYSGSIVEGHVNAYKDILEGEEYGIDVVEARLISYDELTDSETFACVDLDYCSDKYPWIYSTAYWSGASWNLSGVWSVESDGYFSRSLCSNDRSFGVRPVITISKKEIREHILFTIDGDTYHAEEGMTWSEWVDSEYNTDGFYFGGYHAGVVFPGSGVTYYVCDAIESPVGPNEIINLNFSYLKQQVSAGGSN